MRTAVLETQDESFNERDTAVLANGTEAGLDPLAITPGLERIAPELLALVGVIYFGLALALAMALSRKD